MTDDSENDVARFKALAAARSHVVENRIHPALRKAAYAVLATTDSTSHEQIYKLLREHNLTGTVKTAEQIAADNDAAAFDPRTPDEVAVDNLAKRYSDQAMGRTNGVAAAQWQGRDANAQATRVRQGGQPSTMTPEQARELGRRMSAAHREPDYIDPKTQRVVRVEE